MKLKVIFFSVISCLVSTALFANDSTDEIPNRDSKKTYECEITPQSDFAENTQHYDGYNYNASVRVSENGATPSNSEIRCPAGMVLVGLNLWHASQGSTHSWNDLRGICQKVKMTCQWK